MKNTIYIVLACFLSISSFGQQADFNITEVSQLDYSSLLNDIWGYVDQDGIEYAVVGTRTETSVVSLEDPANPVEVHRVPGDQSIWRDMKSFQNFIYSVTDQGDDGLLIIDMSDPQNIRDTFITQFTLNSNNYTLRTTHNIYMENGYLYLSGSNINNGGVIVLDLNQNPWSPTLAGFAGARYSHDCVVRNDTIYSADINDGYFTVYDATDKSNISEIVTQETTGKFSHNCWISDDGKYLFTTDEKSNKNLDAYDISDLENIELLDFYRPLATYNEGVIPHNTHYLNGFLVTSWYRDGVKIINGKQPDILVEVGSFDSYAGSGDGFDGNWGAYPYLPSGLLIISDMQSGLFVLDVDYQDASYVRGLVRDSETLNPINSADVKIKTDKPNGHITKPTGIFGTGVNAEGNHTVTFTHPLYYDTTAIVNLKADSTINLDVYMRPKFSLIGFNGIVMDEIGNPIEDAIIEIENGFISESFSTAESGMFQGSLPNTEYTIRAGKWGYGDTIIYVQSLADVSEIVLQSGYHDRFNMDMGWTIEGDATAGQFERAVPEGTIVDGFIGNPFSDSDDFGNTCYVTGAKAGGSAYEFDVDNGSTLIKSPQITWPDDADSVYISFATWFTNYDISDPTNDFIDVNVDLSDFIFIPLLVREDTASTWKDTTVVLTRDQFLGQNEFSISFFIADEAPGNLTEGGVDNFRLSFNKFSSTRNISSPTQVAITPNPASDYISITPDGLNAEVLTYTIFDAHGKSMLTSEINNHQASKVDISGLNSGMYFIQIYDTQGKSNIGRFSVHR